MSIAALLKAAEFIERRDREAEHGYASTLPIPDDLRSVVKRPKSKKSQGSRTSHNELEKNRRAHLRNCLEKLKDIVPLGPEASRHTTLGLLTKAKKFIKNLEEKEKRHGAYREQLARKQRYLRRRLEQLGGKHQPEPHHPRQPDHSHHNHHHNHHRQYEHHSTRHYDQIATRQYDQRQYDQIGSRQYDQRQFQIGSRQFDPIAMRQLEQLDQMEQMTQMTQRRSVSECSSASASSGTASRCELPDSEPASISESDEVDVIGYTSNQSDTDDHSSVQSGSGDSGVALSASRLSLAHMDLSFT